ncbi:ABC transporter ATP-binding protein [Magnetospira sp. QH-2]|uniref:ABC transporter ATP-binding protein n=1 Tax=Magnetospira sp. (strain QH-2) TaxID=1288970 RepID=UPI0003E818E2|nr:ABC transporter ATP-binding protein [Magnetospira sp. QH-2]CCQ74918.1 putative oligopeptide/dipeptide ABC transporter, ATP-binding protein [Magnetospira sp. QH-2]
MKDLLTVENLEVKFTLHSGEMAAVRDISFRMRPGKTVALVGESGSGKSTVAQAIMGLLPNNGRVSGGTIAFDDHGKLGDANGVRRDSSKRLLLAEMPRDGKCMQKVRGGEISMIFQDPMTSLSPLYTVGNQVSEALDLHLSGTELGKKARVLDMLDRVGFPDAERAYEMYPFELSGGMRQRAMIAMALVSGPSLLIADEPTTALDVTVQAQILKLIKDLQREFGMAVLLITHDLGVVANIADEVVVMYHGQVMESGPADEIFADAQHDYLKALFRALPRLHGHGDERLVPIREVKVQHGDLLGAKEPPPEGADQSNPLLTVRNLDKIFTGKKKGNLFGVGPNVVHAVNNVSFDIARGESLGLVGESGCGKTTVSKIIMRALQPNGGALCFDDHGEPVDLLALNDKKMIPYRRRMQYVFQDPASSLDPRMTVFGLISEPLEIHGLGDKAYRMDMVKELMSAVGLDHRFLNRYPHSFSGGQRQRIGIARALALQPDLLLCDEPVSALDVSVQAQVLNLLKDLQNELNLTYLFVSHNLAVVRYLCDRILVMCKGRVVEEGPTDAIYEDPRHPYTRTLLAAVPDADRGSAWLSAFAGEAEGSGSDPESWPKPYALQGDMSGLMQTVGDGHRVLVTGDRSEVAA